MTGRSGNEPGDRAARTRELLEAIPEIPALPPALLQVWEMTSRDETSAEDLGRAMGTDAGLTGAVLRLANSAYFGFPRKVSTVTQAIVILGFDTVKSLAMGASVFRTLRSDGRGALDTTSFHHHSLVTAMASRMLLDRLAPRKGGTAFAAGILHDLGKLVIVQHLGAENDEIRRRVDDGEGMDDVERDVLGMTHAQVGAWFAQRWSFPGELAAAVRWHHEPGGAEEHGEYAAVVHLGDVIAHRTGAGAGDRPAPPVPSLGALRELRLDEAELDRVRSTVAEMVIDRSAAELALGT